MACLFFYFNFFFLAYDLNYLAFYHFSILVSLPSCIISKFGSVICFFLSVSLWFLCRCAIAFLSAFPVSMYYLQAEVSFKLRVLLWLILNSFWFLFLSPKFGVTGYIWSFQRLRFDFRILQLNHSSTLEAEHCQQFPIMLLTWLR